MVKKWVLLVLAAMLTVPAPAFSGSKVLIHMVVVPVEAREGRDFNQALLDLKKKLAELAGGYTFLGRTDGGMLTQDGRLDSENNFSFIVAAPRNIIPDLEKNVARLFNTEKPFIMVWEGETNWSD
jgi:hypothetical protein